MAKRGSDGLVNKGLGEIGSADDLIERLMDAIPKVGDQITVGIAKGMSELTREAVNVMKTQIVYAQMKGVEPVIPFLDRSIKKIEQKSIKGKGEKNV